MLGLEEEGGGEGVSCRDFGEGEMRMMEVTPTGRWGCGFGEFEWFLDVVWGGRIVGEFDKTKSHHITVLLCRSLGLFLSLLYTGHRGGGERSNFAEVEGVSEWPP